MQKFLGKYSDLLYGVMRIVVGVLFACHGAQKLFGMLGGQQQALGSLMGLAGVIEFFGGLLIALGIFTSWAAFISSGEMAVGYFMGHTAWFTFPNGFWPIQNQGELAVLYCFVFLYIASRGGGKLALGKG